ncbi:MAG TPA: sugar ABC transporter substrate-binding protein [Aliiroseovarius sp.]|nr:sugar ABC transporter substrate-binding protein [Aliiroseovarius sp.]
MTKTFTALMTAATLALSASSPVWAEGERFVLISHAPDSDSWWNTIKNAIQVAGDQMDVTVEYRNPPTGDLADMARIVEQAAASGPDGIIVTIADFDVLQGPITSAVDQGIPVITINSGTQEQSEALGALMHVGQPEYTAGLEAGKRAARAGVTSFLCVNHYATNPASVERCRGFADAIGADLSSSMIDSGQDPAEIKNKVLAYLTANPDTGAVLTLGPTSAHPTLAALDEIGMSGEIYFGTFDLSGEIAEAIKADVIAFGIDQQPFLQGYMPVVILTNLVRYGVLPSGHMNSGPGFVTKDNIGLVEEFAGVYR